MSMEPQTQPVSVDVPPAQTTEPVPGEMTSPSQEQGFLYPESVKKFFYVVLFLFFASSGGVLLSSVTRMEVLAITMYGWFIAIALAALGCIIMFFAGLFTENKHNLVGKAFLFFIIFALVGYGSCLVNISGLGLEGI
jgi:hypothetical protein